MREGDYGQKRYMEDKPSDCKYCYFWEKRKESCGLPECYYLAASGMQEESGQTEGMMPGCFGCPYGLHSRCIGYCLQKAMQEILPATGSA